MILVVDDESAIRFFLKRRLTAWNFQVMTAENGSRALELVRSGHPDILLTDLFMPEGDGFELLANVRKESPDLPVIVMSGHGEPCDIIQVLRLGAWDYLCKPFENMAYLRVTIAHVLEKVDLIKENRRYREHLEDIVAQKTAELLKSEQRYRTVAEFTYDWEYWIAPDGEFVYISPSCERLTGYSALEFIENPSILREIVHPDDQDHFERHIIESHLRTEICRLDFRIIRRDYEQRWIEHCCQPVTDLKGAYLGRRCSNRDITYQKLIESDLINQQKVLVNKSISLEKTNQALKTLLDQREIEKKSIEQSMVSNLKRYVLPYLDDLEQQNIGKDTQTYLNIIRSNIEQLISPISKSLGGAYLALTPTEIKVADLIRQGRSTKSIAASLNTSGSTIEKHRNKIRKKLNVLKKKVNLYTYLNSLS